MTEQSHVGARRLLEVDPLSMSSIHGSPHGHLLDPSPGSVYLTWEESWAQGQHSGK